ncbi:MAG: CocE/NonD family hydrolase [Alcanivoracaceae bacterium]|nr:CocE/NonD family hydrolase [Alcanivoracaceae bacterium]
MKRILLLILAGLLSACSARSTLPPMGEQPLKAKRYQVEVTSHDGLRLGVTVWQPELAAGTSAPLVMHTHGFGIQRMDGVVGLYENVIASGLVAKSLWQQGFWLITWDQRGHGDSEGIINVMDPDKEVRDVTTLLDWAEQNIPRLSRDAVGDIRVGMIGESYGGGVQLLASVKEPRIDAIVPITAWYDLAESLAPGDLPKGGWIKVLYLMGDWWNFRKLHPYLRENFALARDGIITDGLKQNYASHGLSWYCERGEQRKVDALLVQGFRDVLFDVGQALKTRECLSAAGGEVSLIAQTGGHLLPMEQHTSSTPVWYWDKWLHCEGERQRTNEVVANWLAATLTDVDLPERPSICLSVDDWGLALNQWPSLYQEIVIPEVVLKGKRSGSWRWLTAPADWLVGWRTDESLTGRYASPRDGRLRPAFVPLHTASAAEKRFGSPQLTLDFAAPTPVLAALAVRREGSARPRPVNDQMIPVRAGVEVVLPAMAVALQPGDQLGLMLFSRHPQFNTLTLDFSDGVAFTGRLGLPVDHAALVERGDPSVAHSAAVATGD